MKDIVAFLSILFEILFYSNLFFFFPMQFRLNTVAPKLTGWILNFTPKSRPVGLDIFW